MALLEISGIFNEIMGNKRKAFLVFLATVGFVFAAAGALGHFVIMVLVMIEIAMAFFIGEFELRKFGFELVTLVAVLTGYLFGPGVGGIMGLALLSLHFILTRSFGAYVFYCVPAMGAVGFLAGSSVFTGWLGGDIALIGIMLSLLYNLVTGGLGSFLFRDTFDEMLWSGTNLLFNLILFYRFAPIVLSMIG